MKAANCAFVQHVLAIRNRLSATPCAHLSASNTHLSSRSAPSRYAPASMSAYPSRVIVSFDRDVSHASFDAVENPPHKSAGYRVVFNSPSDGLAKPSVFLACT